MFDDAPYYEPLVRYGDARELPLENESVDCIITSPPYNVGLEYDKYQDCLPWKKYVEELVWPTCEEMFRIAVPSARIWVNVMPSVPQKDQSDRFPLSEVWSDALRRAGFKYRDTVIWNQDSHDSACAWGSWARPSAPNLRGGYETILSYYKEPYKRPEPSARKGWKDAGLVPKIEGEDGYKVGWRSDWPDITRNIWKINPVRRKTNAPAPFPDELVRRAVRLSTWPGQVCVDPFAGSGVTPRVVREMDRIGLGFDIDA